MLTTYFKSQSTVARYRSGSAGPFLDRFISWLSDRGYQWTSIRHHVQEVARFATWCDAFGLGSEPPNQESLAKLLAHLTEQGCERYACGLYRHIYQSARVSIHAITSTSLNRGRGTVPRLTSYSRGKLVGRSRL